MLIIRYYIGMCYSGDVTLKSTALWPTRIPAELWRSLMDPQNSSDCLSLFVNKCWSFVNVCNCKQHHRYVCKTSHWLRGIIINYLLSCRIFLIRTTPPRLAQRFQYTSVNVWICTFYFYVKMLTFLWWFNIISLPEYFYEDLKGQCCY